MSQTAESDPSPSIPAAPARPGRPTCDAAQTTWPAVLDALRQAGQDHGRTAADWWAQDAVGGRASGDTAATARTVLAGIDDGDPAILDTLPTCDLSGRWADSPTEADLYTQAAPDDAPRWDDLDPDHRGEAIDAYRDGFDTATTDRVVEQAVSTATGTARGLTPIRQ